ncbi:uncharacterized protein LOC121834559 [Ixodes scapularis]|uniref:uncharacterized protein LOC121834559 n=1 Tax=Ixodes scapularis TaxID=6945 RepID=UPI001C38E553|nr:uncharacterized protein LOC121834559 [Ixodes scapularis]
MTKTSQYVKSTIGVISGDVHENSFWGFVTNKYNLFQKLRKLYEKESVDLPKCKVQFARRVFWIIFGSGSEIK